ncbi:hypothetical protein SFR_1167 [Streptomyces sp. FR-008]|nr:hypothetical protein SFR_1167 [Streptomyces sp. FR-008]
MEYLFVVHRARRVAGLRLAGTLHGVLLGSTGATGSGGRRAGRAVRRVAGPAS